MQIFESPESQLNRCIFVGPSLWGVELDRTIMRFGPAQLGSVYLAAKSGYNVIGLVDAIFGNVPTVWHKEILYAIGRGCVVYGSSSAGALRAAELHTYGMHGIGLCYRLYRAGVITDDDEVAVLHGDASTNYVQLSEPLINARLTFRKLRRNGFLTVNQELEIITRFKTIHFSERTFSGYGRALTSVFGASEGDRIHQLLKSHYRDTKQEDGRQLVSHLLDSPSSCNNSGFFLRTSHWRHQFEELESDLKPLQ
jgi:hypothetical protein